MSAALATAQCGARSLGAPKIADADTRGLTRKGPLRKHAFGLRLHARLQIDPIRPDVDIAARRQIAFLPSPIFVFPLAFQPRDHRWRKVWSLLAQQGREGLLEIPGLPRPALSFAPPKPATAQEWAGKWRRDGEAEIALRNRGDEVEASGLATSGGSDPQRVRTGAVNIGEIAGSGRPRDGTLTLGYADGAAPPHQTCRTAPRGCGSLPAISSWRTMARAAA